MYALRTSATVALDQSGNGQIVLGPQRANESWKVERISTAITPNSDKAQLRVYANSISDGSYLDGSRRAYQDTSETNISVPSMETLVFVYSGGSPGSYATISLVGTVY